MTRSFSGFKRNQVQEAIAAVLKPASRQQATEMLGRVKRLLDTDHAHGRNKRASDPEKANFAFHRDGMPGRGYENIFSEFDAFALLVALRLMGSGLPQGTVVSLLRRLRPQLEQHFGQIVRPRAVGPFDEQKARRQAKPGDLNFDATDPRFIVIVWEGDRRGSRSVALCQGQREVFELFHRYGPGYSFTLLELVTSALVLSSALAQTKPRTRGRAPK
jgi:hypothetical protein